MSDSNFAVNADAMTPAVDGLAQLGDRLSQITQNLESKLDGLGTPWGDDKNGHNFFQQYGKSRDQTLSGMSSMVDATHGVSKGIQTMIKGYNNINDTAKEKARNLQTTGGDSDGSGGGQSQLQPEQSVMRSRIPAEPFQRATLREGTLLPRETLRAKDGEPVQPFLRSTEGEPVQPADRGEEPLLPMERAELMPAEKGIPAEPLSPLLPMERAELMPAEKGIPAEPLSPLLPMERGELMPAEKNLPADQFVRDEAPSTEGTVTFPGDSTPVEPYSALQPALRGEYVRDDAPLTEGRVEPLQPTHFDRMEPLQPAQRTDYAPATEGTPLQPTHMDRMEPLRPAEPLQPAHFDSVRPAEPVQPAHFGRMEPAVPAERVHVDAMRPTEPVQPTHFDSVRPVEPVQPAHFDSVRPTIPAEQPVAFDRAEPLLPAEQVRDYSIPGEPMGFAELEPERYLSAREPEVPEK